MTDVAISEKISAIADACFAAASGATIDGDEFAKSIFITNLEIGGFSGVFQVLRLLTNRAVSVKLIACAGAHWTRERDVML